MGNGEIVLTNPSLPHQREIFALVELVHEAFSDSNFLGVVITDSMQHGHWLIQRLADSVKWDIPNTRIHRDGVEVKGGGKVIVLSTGNPSALMGLHPTKIVLFGLLGKLFYWIHSFDCDVKAVA